MTGGLIQKFGNIIYPKALQEIEQAGHKLNVIVNDNARESGLIGIRNYSLKHFGLVDRIERESSKCIKSFGLNNKVHEA